MLQNLSPDSPLTSPAFLNRWENWYCYEGSICLLQSKFSDCVVACEGREFRCHKNILASRSTVFDAMFTHDMEENRKSKVDIVDLDGDTVHDMIRYIYSGKVYWAVLQHIFQEHKSKGGGVGGQSHRIAVCGREVRFEGEATWTFSWTAPYFFLR